MKNHTLIFERIIWGNLRPWLYNNNNEEKFIQLFEKLILIEPKYQMFYEIDFYRCFNCKTKYYRKLIISETNCYCNGVIGLINAHADIRFKKYLLNGRLKKIEALLRQSANLIKDNYYELQYIDTYKSDFDTGREHKADTYVIQLLKTALLKVYLEIQEIFKCYVPREDYMEIEDLYIQVLTDAIPEETFLKRLPTPEIAPVPVKTDAPVTDRVSIPHREEPKSFRFDRLDTNPGALNDVADSLKLHLLIDKKSALRDFKKVFSGEEVTNPIRWTGTPSEIYWFIYLIYTKYKFVDDVRQQQWKIASRCFIQADGPPFEAAKLRKLKKPNSNRGLIEKIVLLLK